jgi:hypothetical protein
MRILSALALAMAATTQAQAFSNDCSLSFKGSYRKTAKNRKEADSASYTNHANSAAITVAKWSCLVCGFDPKLKGKNITTIIITSILLALFSLPVLAQEEKPKLYVKAGAARRLIIKYLIDHLDRCMSLPAATQAEIEAADRCHAILTEKVNHTPLSVLIPFSHVTRETDANKAKMDALLDLYDAFLYGMENGLKEGLTARKGRRH